MMAHKLKEPGEQTGPRQTAPGGAPRPLLAISVIAVLTALVYARTFQVPWYLDDLRGIVENQNLRSLSREFSQLLLGRGLSEFTFALNYHFGGLAVGGYHAVNLLIHIGSAALACLLLLRGARLPPAWALAGGLLFALHPLQTQAVTYIVQRMSSQAGFFFLLACLLYLTALDATRSRKGWLLAAWLAGAAAVLSKESAAVLPLALWLCERYWRPGRSTKAQALTILPFFIPPAWKVVEGLFLPLQSGESIVTLSHLDRLAALQHASPINYLVTQFSVIWLYIRLLFLPFGQALEYDWAITADIFSIRNLIAGLGVAGLVALAWKLRHRRPLTSFGIVWFFLTLSVESTLIPLDPVFEHRLYLPLFGFILVVLDGLLAIRAGRWPLMVMTSALIVLGMLTWQRNLLWNDPVALYEDGLRRYPRNERAHDELANHYVERQQYAAAEKTLRAGLEINPSYPRLWNSLGLLQARQGAHDQAIGSYRRAIESNPDYYLAYSNLGVALSAQDRWLEALDYYRQALLLKDNPKTRFHAAVAYYNLGRLREAEEELRRALRMNPGQARALQLLGLTLQRLGRIDEARQVRMQFDEIAKQRLSESNGAD